MSKSKRSQSRPQPSGGDHWWETAPMPGSGDRKAMQLSRQVERALSFILGEFNCDVLSSLQVESVVPAPNASRLQVTVSSLDEGNDPAEILQRLSGAYSAIRAEVATAIHRKRVPELAFLVR